MTETAETETIIRFVLSNFTLSFLVLGLAAAGVTLLRAPRPLDRATIVETLFAHYLLFAIGVTFLYNFTMHVFFPDTAARFIGWTPSPFQTEVGFASLGFGAVAILAFRGGYGLRLGAVLAPSIFLLGAAAGHVREMVVARNFEPGNAGIIFYTDIAVPLMGFALLWLSRSGRSDPRNPA